MPNKCMHSMWFWKIWTLWNEKWSYWDFFNFKWNRNGLNLMFIISLVFRKKKEIYYYISNKIFLKTHLLFANNSQKRNNFLKSHFNHPFCNLNMLWMMVDQIFSMSFSLSFLFEICINKRLNRNAKFKA